MEPDIQLSFQARQHSLLPVLECAVAALILT